MNYELAKQLKDAGFPQVGNGFLHSEKSWPDELYVPTLSELIEACGESFHELRRENEKWFAATWSIGDAEGSTPEEAVARLWLALHAK